MTGIVWGRTQERANEELERVKDQYLANGRVLTSIKKDSFQTQEGDYWKAVKANDFARGYLCNISYIDKTIPEDIINEIVVPATRSYPFQGLNYFFDI